MSLQIPSVMHKHANLSMAPRSCCLHMDRWHLRYQQSTEQGKVIVWSIDKNSADALKAIDERRHFGLGRVTFRVSRGPGPSKAARQ